MCTSMVFKLISAVVLACGLVQAENTCEGNVDPAQCATKYATKCEDSALGSVVQTLCPVLCKTCPDKVIESDDSRARRDAKNVPAIFTNNGTVTIQSVAGSDVCLGAVGGLTCMKDLALGATVDAVITKQAEDATSLNETLVAFANATDIKLDMLENTLDKTVKTQIGDLNTKLESAATTLGQAQTAANTKIAKNEKNLGDYKKEVSQKFASTSVSLTKNLQADYTKKISDGLNSKYCKGLPPKGFTPVKEAAADFKAGRRFAGMQFVGLTCKAGEYSTVPMVYCTTSGRYCGNPNYCAKTPTAGCAKCLANCNSCTTGATCDKCNSGYILIGGKCTLPSSCWQLKGSLSDGVHKVRFDSPKGGKKNLDGRCIIEGGRAHTMIGCNVLGDCRAFSRFQYANGCQKYGYEVTPFRNRKHYELAFTHWGVNAMRQMAPSAHVYKPSGGGNYVGCQMRYGHAHCAQWRAKDGKSWWLRDSTYGEPNGDYTANCHLNVHGMNKAGGFYFNDGGCYSSGSRYWCGTADYDGKGSPNGI